MINDYAKVIGCCEIKKGSEMKRTLVTNTGRTVLVTKFFRSPYFFVLDGLDAAESFKLFDKFHDILL